MPGEVGSKWTSSSSRSQRRWSAGGSSRSCASFIAVAPVKRREPPPGVGRGLSPGLSQRAAEAGARERQGCPLPVVVTGRGAAALTRTAYRTPPHPDLPRRGEPTLIHHLQRDLAHLAVVLGGNERVAVDHLAPDAAHDQVDDPSP